MRKRTSEKLESRITGGPIETIVDPDTVDRIGFATIGLKDGTLGLLFDAAEPMTISERNMRGLPDLKVLNTGLENADLYLAHASEIPPNTRYQIRYKADVYKPKTARYRGGLA